MFWSSSDIRYTPTAVIAAPAIGNIRYLPVRPTMVPLAMAVSSSPMTRGSIRSPDEVADAPLTYCSRVGRKVIEPIIAKPTMKLRIEARVNTRPRNNRIGRIGSSARSSTKTKMASEISEAPNSPMMVAEPHAYWVPPQEVARISPLAPRPTNSTPR